MARQTVLGKLLLENLWKANFHRAAESRDQSCFTQIELNLLMEGFINPITAASRFVLNYHYQTAFSRQPLGLHKQVTASVLPGTESSNLLMEGFINSITAASRFVLSYHHQTAISRRPLGLHKQVTDSVLPD